MQRRSTRPRELIPGLAAQSFAAQICQLDLSERLGADGARWMAARTVGREVGGAFPVHDHLSHDGAS